MEVMDGVTGEVIEVWHDSSDSDHVTKCDPCWNEAAKEHYEAEAERFRPSVEEDEAMGRAREHDLGEHADFMDVDCPSCVEEMQALGMAVSR